MSKNIEAVLVGKWPADGPDGHVNFQAPAILRKWPSRNNQRYAEGTNRTSINTTSQLFPNCRSWR